MGNKTKRKIITFITLLSFILYCFLCVKTLDYDFYFEPTWSINFDSIQKNQEIFFCDQTKNIEGFILGNQFGFFYTDGSLCFLSDTNEYVSVSHNKWVEHTKDAKEFIINNLDGKQTNLISDTGFIHLDNQSFYIFHPGGDSLSQYTHEGEKLWTREHIAPITAFNSSESGTVIGYADGKLVCVDTQGNELVSFYPSGSNYPIILGVAISKDASMVACVSGLEPQRFLLFKIEKKQSKVVLHTYLNTNVRRQVYTAFNSTGNFLFFETDNQLAIVNCKTNDIHFTPIQGRIINAGQNSLDNLLILLTKDQNSYFLVAIEQPNHLLASTEIHAKEAFLIQRNDIIFLGIDNSISRINIKGLK